MSIYRSELSVTYLTKKILKHDYGGNGQILNNFYQKSKKFLPNIIKEKRVTFNLPIRYIDDVLP